jgi:transposase InsO family protein
VTLDLFNREAVGWSVKPRMTTDLVTDALTMVWLRCWPARSPHHSDSKNTGIRCFRAALGLQRGLSGDFWCRKAFRAT